MALSVVKRPTGYLGNGNVSSGTFTNNSSVITSVAHGLVTGNIIYVTACDPVGFWYVTKLTDDTFNIREFAGDSAYEFVGSASLAFEKMMDSHNWNAVHLPIVYKLLSTLWPSNSVDTARTVSNYENDLGYVKLTLSGAHGCTELEFVKVTFTGGDTEVYQVLTWYSSTVITISLPYTGGLTFVSVQKYYNNYHAKIKIYAGLNSSHTFSNYNAYSEICEINAVPDSSGVITINVNESLKEAISIIENRITLDTLPNDLASFCQFYISYAEAYSYSEGGYTLLDFVGPYSADGTECYASNSSLPFKNKHSGTMSDYIRGTDSGAVLKFLTPSDHPVLFAEQSNVLGAVSQFFDISYINQYGTGLRMKREAYRGGVIVNLFFDSIPNNGIGVYRYEVDRSAYLEDRIDLTLQYDDGGGYDTISETKTILVDDTCGPSGDNYIDLSWKNYLGGHDYWRFKSNSEYGADILSSTRATKNIFPDWPNSWGANADTVEHETSRKSKQTISLIAENLTEAQVNDLFRIKLSPLVQIINSRSDRRTVIPDKSSFQYFKRGEKEYSITLNIEYTDDFPSQSL